MGFQKSRDGNLKTLCDLFQGTELGVSLQVQNTGEKGLLNAGGRGEVLNAFELPLLNALGNQLFDVESKDLFWFQGVNLKNQNYPIPFLV